MLKSSPSAPPGSETRDGPNGSTASPNPPEYIFEEIPLPSFHDASPPSATTGKPETPSFATQKNRNADARTKELKMSSKCQKPFPTFSLNSTNTRRKSPMESSEGFSTISSDTKKLKIIPLFADHHHLKHLIIIIMPPRFENVALFNRFNTFP